MNEMVVYLLKNKVLGVDMEYFTAIEKDSQFKGFSLI